MIVNSLDLNIVRLKQLDFLRGVAILLIMLRHIPITGVTTNMGWIGVDLFFVLSGFLISGLLFKEYKQFGNIKPFRFLIRRGFKIYPVYFIFYIPYIILLARHHSINIPAVLSDLTFTQNYFYLGYGYAYPASWSLAVEEHFYLGFTILLWLHLKFNTIQVRSSQAGHTTYPPFIFFLITCMIVCLLMRFISNIYSLADSIRLFSMTHLRIDSLLMGVLVAYFYHFDRKAIENFFRRHRLALCFLSICGLSWPAFVAPSNSFFIKTLGFTVLYSAFAVVLLFFLFESDINKKLNKILGKAITNIISIIGYSSYSIYIIHSLVIDLVFYSFNYLRIQHRPFIFFFSCASVSVLCGMVMTHKFETIFLQIREQKYPARSRGI